MCLAIFMCPDFSLHNNNFCPYVFSIFGKRDYLSLFTGICCTVLMLTLARAAPVSGFPNRALRTLCQVFRERDVHGQARVPHSSWAHTSTQLVRVAPRFATRIVPQATIANSTIISKPYGTYLTCSAFGHTMGCFVHPRTCGLCPLDALVVALCAHTIHPESIAGHMSCDQYSPRTVFTVSLSEVPHSVTYPKPYAMESYSKRVLPICLCIGRSHNYEARSCCVREGH